MSTSNRLPDAEARKRIVERVDLGMAVEAAAGAGKTTSMVGRVAGLILSGVPVTKIAAITFTEKAAAELALRVREELEKELVKAGDGPDERRGLIERALSELDSARITTIHAFALAMVKERPVEAGIDPAAEIIDELGAAIRRREGFPAWLGSLSGQRLGALARTVRLGLSVDKLSGIAARLSDNRDVADMLKENLKRRDAGSIDDLADRVRGLAAAAAALLAECEQHVKNRKDRGYQATLSWAGLIKDMVSGLDGWGLLERFVSLNPKQVDVASGAKPNWKSAEFKDARRQAMKDARAMVTELQSSIRSMVMDDALLLIAEYVEYDWDRRRRDGLLNFQDVLILARDLLYENPEIREQYQRRWMKILVDEFQDTDPLQVEIIDLLVGEDHDKLFMVGDPKQSIYRFRRADISVYGMRVGRLEDDVGRKTEILSTNFRSVPGIIEWVNDAFSKIIVSRKSYQAAYVDMRPFRKPNQSLPPVGVLHPRRLEDLPAKVADVRIAEARSIAALIDHLVRSGRYKIYDKSAEGLVPLAFHHVAVLYSARPSDPDEWLMPFSERGVPFASDMAHMFYSRDEVAMMGLAVRAIEDPSDSLALFGVLRSPLFGFSDEELFLFKRDGGAIDYRTLPGAGSRDLLLAFELLGRLHLSRNSRPVAETLNDLLSATGARVSCLASLNGPQGLADVERVIEDARSFQRITGGGFSAFARRLDLIEDLEVGSRAPASPDASEDHVRFSTVHGAKGLEFPVVIVANLNVNAKRSAGDVLADRLSKRAAVACGKMFRSGGYGELAADEEQHLFEESKRLLYVAATRARDALIWSVFPPLSGGDDEDSKKKRKAMAAKYIGILPESITTFGRDGDEVYHWDVDPDKAPTGAGEALDQPDKREDAFDPERFIKEREAALANASTEIKVRLASKEKAAPVDTAPEPGAGRVRSLVPGALLGSVVHEVMEEIDLGAERAPMAPIEAGLSRVGIEDAADDAERLVNNCLGAGPVRRAVAGGSWFREVPYSVWIGGELHEGKIDLVFREGERVVVVDYKTDRVPADAAASRLAVYRGQGEAYREAVRRATGSEEVEVWFVFAWPGVEVEL